ncbi:7-cyano-7-deazaguanine/7-aminomethyl-7-deazaguanine transporter [Tatumella sp. TA1]|uniref:7-cyano-7-deazaguanine/7-aminomethyl-7- deazaguanine transporter n=1 Tax=Rosenbergiella collisarenosi TaxID=1544695 RepID=UPI0008F8A551|nr:7-cyano-7-deazaguanine/7-aminomethyl-7-deazaguanine transporter [Rosenbergiella collisarenosi]MBT0722223.1 7-cyano-7-deazaguanine/7-aminomethyl-7-deazaguanine transporter [Rosenbergiella collisarenosi]QGX90170.1 7-cyano-7-deazaguanine/7-aminomethyl-7-deazaguanine transporter [Tatumella sp. TA1]
MYHLNDKQRKNLLLPLAIFHLLIITSSNYLVQLPVSIFGFTTTWGAFSFPFIFLATDLTVRIFGAMVARRVIFYAMLPALVLSFIISSLFYQATWQGFQALTTANTVVMRIALASFCAYMLGQFLDIFVFNRLRQARQWWLAPVAAMFFGNLSDTLAFFSIAFFNSSDAFMATHWQEIAVVDYSYKVLICLVFFIPVYGVLLNTIIKRLLSPRQVHSFNP